MSLTKNMKRTGAARVAEIQDERDYIREAEKQHRVEFTKKWHAALDELKRIDPDWEKWYDERPEQTCGEMLPLIKERIALLAPEVSAGETTDAQEEIRS